MAETPGVLTCSTCGTSNADGAKFCQECGAAFAAQGETRRRLVTALFCDLVGSTELGERLDAERLSKVLDRYFEAMRTAIERHGGVVEKFIGDAVVGTFGLPTAHEDDTLRAVRAAVDMRESAGTLDAELDDPKIRIRVRIGIDSGEAFADESSARKGSIASDAFNTAARLQSIAEPGDVVVSGAAERMLRGGVELAPIGPVELKGKAEPVDAYLVVRVRESPAQFETPMVGRDRTMAKIVEALQDGIDADACVLATVLGPPGVGKSRLATAFSEAVRDRATILVGQTPSYGDGVTFAPLAELLAHAADRPSGDAEEVAAALRERLAGEPDGASVGDRLAQILGVGEALASDASWAVRRLFEVLAAERPLVVLLEDVHWAEPPMLDLIDAVVERLRGPSLVLCLARPELLEQRPTWGAGKPRAATTTLPPLAPEAARELAELLLGKQTPASVVDRVCETAEGNPLYLEQLTAMLADQGLLEDGRWVGSNDAEVEIPASLQALLAARFDRLDATERLLLERASVEGRRFRVAAVRALAPDVAPEEIQAAIDSLEKRGFVHPEDEAAGRWRFAHSLVREGAYRGLSKEVRAELHERLAGWIQREDADQADVDESVARHLERALRLREELGERAVETTDLAERAGELFADAGSRAFSALDLITARDLLGRAATLLPNDSARRLDILPNLGVALSETGKPAETEALLSDAVEQARAAGSERDALRATIQLLSNRVFRSPTEDEMATAAAQALEATAWFEEQGDDVGLAEACVVVEYLEWMQGHVDAAGAWALRAMRYGIAAGRSREATQGAADVVGYATSGSMPFDRCVVRAEEVLAWSDDPISQSAGEALLVVSALAMGDEPGFRRHERRWSETIDGNGLAWLGAVHGMFIADVETMVGRAEAAERRLREARDVLVALGDIWWVGQVDCFLCSAVAAQDRASEFLRRADSFEASVQVPDRENVIRHALTRARAHMLRGSAADAQTEIRRALELVESTDLVLTHVEVLFTLADVLEARDRLQDAAEARAEAVTKLRAKGALAAVALHGAP